MSNCYSIYFFLLSEVFGTPTTPPPYIVNFKYGKEEAYICWWNYLKSQMYIEAGPMWVQDFTHNSIFLFKYKAHIIIGIWLNWFL